MSSSDGEGKPKGGTAGLGDTGIEREDDTEGNDGFSDSSEGVEWGDFYSFDYDEQNPHDMEILTIELDITGTLEDKAMDQLESLESDVRLLATTTDTDSRAEICSRMVDALDEYIRTGIEIESHFESIIGLCRESNRTLVNLPRFVFSKVWTSTTWKHQSDKVTAMSVLDNFDKADKDEKMPEEFKLLPETKKRELRIRRLLNVPVDRLGRECAICLDKVILPAEVPCRHIFHESCLEQVRSAGGLCPECRGPLHFSVDWKQQARQQVRQELRRLGLEDLLLGEPDVIMSYCGLHMFKWHNDEEGVPTCIEYELPQKNVVKVRLEFNRPATSAESSLIEGALRRRAERGGDAEETVEIINVTSL